MNEPVEAFVLCPIPGCNVAVWGSTRTVNHCRAHGGNELRFPEIAESDEWGLPRRDDEGTVGRAALSEHQASR